MERNQIVDFWRGIAIVSVVIGHMIYNISSLDLLYNIIYSFHMPLFFFLSAYVEELYGEKYRNRESQMLRRRALAILLPYLSWAIITWTRGTLDFKELASILIGYKQTGLWFLAVLFCFKCVHYSIWHIQKKCFKTLNLSKDILTLLLCEGIIVLLAWVTRLPYVVNMISYAIPYFFGMVFAKNKIIRDISKGKLATVAAVTYLVGIQFFSFYNTSWTTQVLRIALSLCMILILLKLNDIIKLDNKLNKLICLFGRNTMGIFLLHTFFTDVFDVFAEINSNFIALCIVILLAFGISALCVLIMKITSQFPIVYKLLFGNSKA